MASVISAGTTAGTAIAIAGDTSGVLQLQTNGTTPAITIDTSQNVGIGTSSPNKGSVSRAVTLNGTAGNIVEFCVSDTRVGWVYGDNNLTALSAGGSRYIALETNGTERMRITSGGDLLVGTTSVNPHSSGTYGTQLSVGGALIGVNNTHAIIAARWNGNGEVIRLQRDNTDVGSIDVTTTATSYNTSSDYRLKENIAPITGALNTVAQLKPVTYKWKVDGSDGQGFIAHELQAVVPDCVTGEKDAVDEEGNPKYQGIDTSFLVATLTAAIQELNAKVEAQAVRIAELEGAK